MIVIRRMVDRHRAYTGIFLKGEPPQIFPTSDQEHARILQVYKQDRPHEGIINDFSEDDFPAPQSPASSSTQAAAQKKPRPAKKSSPVRTKAKPGKPTGPLWLTVVSPSPSPTSTQH